MLNLQTLNFCFYSNDNENEILPLSVPDSLLDSIFSVVVSNVFTLDWTPLPIVCI